MQMTRRQFGLVFLSGIVTILFGQWRRWIGWGRDVTKDSYAPARFWTRADRLAG